MLDDKHHFTLLFMYHLAITVPWLIKRRFHKLLNKKIIMNKLFSRIKIASIEFFTKIYCRNLSLAPVFVFNFQTAEGRKKFSDVGRTFCDLVPLTGRQKYPNGPYSGYGSASIPEYIKISQNLWLDGFKHYFLQYEKALYDVINTHLHQQAAGRNTTRFSAHQLNELFIARTNFYHWTHNKSSTADAIIESNSHLLKNFIFTETIASYIFNPHVVRRTGNFNVIGLGSTIDQALRAIPVTDLEIASKLLDKQIKARKGYLGKIEISSTPIDDVSIFDSFFIPHLIDIFRPVIQIFDSIKKFFGL